MNSSAPVVLIDSYAQIYRSFYAVRALTTSTGAASNAVFAMTKFLLKLHHDFKDNDGAFVFDMGRPKHRMELAPKYKENRPPMPEELKSQLPTIRELIAAFGWPVVEFDGFEADDLLAAIAAKFSDRQIRIISSDKDISQVIDDRVEMLVPDRDGKGLLRRSREEVMEKFGVPPEGIVDYLSLIGDSSDNIPGVEGVGPKTAALLMAQFGSIDKMLANAAEIKRDTLREKIISSAELLRLNKKLIVLDKTEPQGANWTEATLKRSAPDFAKIRDIAQKMELRSIIKEIDVIMSGEQPQKDSCAEEKTPVKKNSPEQLEFMF